MKFNKKELAIWCQGKNGTCGNVMIKDNACNHMKCPKCAEYMCWGCNQLWDTNDNGNDDYYWSSDPRSDNYSVHYKLHKSNPPRRDYNGDEPWPNYPWPARKFY